MWKVKKLNSESWVRVCSHKAFSIITSLLIRVLILVKMQWESIGEF